jgi:hypothetical protein
MFCLGLMLFAAPPAAPPPAPGLEVCSEPLAPTPDACTDVPAGDRLSCPLDNGVAALEPVADGVRLLLERGIGPPDRLRAAFACQLSVAQLDPDAPPPCPFLTADTGVVVCERRGRAIVDLFVDPRIADPGVLRERLEVAFPNAKRLTPRPDVRAP